MAGNATGCPTGYYVCYCSLLLREVAALPALQSSYCPSPAAALRSCKLLHTCWLPLPCLWRRRAAGDGLHGVVRYRPAIDGGLSTDLHLGLSLRSSCSSSFHTADRVSASTPRSTLTTTTTMRPAASPDPAYGRSGAGGHGQQTLFVKVYMEGVPMGRKLDLLLLDGYDGLLAIWAAYPDTVGHDHQVVLGEKKARHVVTYQDKEGDWLMAGDVPWELFLAAGVKKLKIARAD
ncbi:hypothetical protein ZWY2020_047969 [Hordeum vulgare]|nr:hypothetical protein ZWY2020_047969 [Hordeum vulgare]